jgi:uncharacterized membrane protein YesL
MTDYAGATGAVQGVQIDANDILKRAWQLYKRLFGRSLVIGGLVFGTLHFVEAVGRSRHSAGLNVLSLVLVFAGTALVQGGLVEIVRGLHVDGDDEASVGEALGRAGGRVMKLVRVSLISSIFIGVGFLVFIVPGFILMTRWAVAVPVAMLEGGNARDALRRSQEMVKGNGWNVFKVLFAVGMLTAVVMVPFLLVSAHAGAFGWWIAVTISSMLTAPYAAHALTVIYYTLSEPQRPVILDPGHRWGSVWDEERGAHEPASVDEYQRRFDEHEQRWGNNT